MSPRYPMLLVLALAIFLGSVGVAGAQTSLDDILTPYLARYDLPALAAAVVQDGKIVARGAVGTRRAGAVIPVTINDRFHLGSDTKAMTALLAAMLVEEHKLRWDSTVAEVFPELSATMTPGLRGVTLEQLLSHTSGIPSDNQAFGNLLAKMLSKTQSQEGNLENLDEMRAWLVRQWSKQPLAAKPGARFAYANMNYVLAGAMLERLSGKTWDELITERIFIPLGLETAGLGTPSSLGRIDAPLGHVKIEGKTKAFLAGPNGDNTSILGPAGIAHMSVLDFAAWAGWNAGEGKRGPALVRPETLRKLHTPLIAIPDKPGAKPGTPKQGKYALGWGELTVAWAPTRLKSHSGSNGKNLAQIWLDPQRDFALVLVTNIGGEQADQAFQALAPELYKKFAATPSAGSNR
ncbi:MAG: serine hydrolase domain-containing protein [Desulfobaccales bacterium]